jgi:hypothetical protein
VKPDADSNEARLGVKIMTFYVEFYAEQAFLSFVKNNLQSQELADQKGYTLELGAVIVLSCAAALEATLNQLFQDDKRLQHYDSLRILEKAETLADFANINIDWGSQPWQEIQRLVRVRNWLAHFKEPKIGLIGGEGKWIKDSINQLPKLDPDVELSLQQVKRYYDCVLGSLLLLAKGLGYQDKYRYLETQEYDYYQVG